MIAKWLTYMSKLHDGVDAILIADKNGIIEYSAMFSEQYNRLMDEGIIGKSVLEVYPDLTEDTSSHFRVMRTGVPIINEKQFVTDFRGNSFVLICSTFPLEYQNEIIGTMEASTLYNKEARLDGKNHLLTKQGEGMYVLDDIITKDPKLLELKAKAKKIASSLSPVLVWGETGTGKELFVQAIHSQGLRASGPFISQNCAAIPTTLLESTLFGTIKGSYTGAENKKGLFELADGGTLFLDEVNSMDLSLQAKILKAIEEKKFRRVGGERDIHADVRVVSAMNVDPVAAVREGIIRKDLFYRLGVVQLNLPALRDRPEDIMLLTDFFLRRFNEQSGRSVKGVSKLVENLFRSYDWPGNVRELRNVVESAFHMCGGDTIQLNDLADYMVYNDEKTALYPDPAAANSDLGLPEALRQYEKRMICDALAHSKTVVEAAKKLKITRQALQYKMSKYDLT